MKKEKGIFGYMFLIGILFAAMCFLVYYIFVGRDMNKSNIDSDYEVISQDELESIVNDELFILFRSNVKSLSDITNDDKLYVTINKLKNRSNESFYSKSDVDSSFFGTSLYRLNINHEPFDIYTYDGEYYRIIDSYALSNMFYNYTMPIAKKVCNFSNDNGRYTISFKYIFPDGIPVENGYGSIQDMLDEKDIVVKIMLDLSTGESIDVQEYLDNNYDSIKNKLDTYNYVFVKENGKIDIVDFYIN